MQEQQLRIPNKSTDNQGEIKIPKTIRKILHRDGTCTIVDPNDPEYTRIAATRKKVYTQTVRIRKITKYDPKTGETTTETEKITEIPQNLTSTVVLEYDTTTAAPLEQVTETGFLTKEPKTKKKTKSPKSKKNPLKKKGNKKKIPQTIDALMYPPPLPIITTDVPETMVGEEAKKKAKKGKKKKKHSHKTKKCDETCSTILPELETIQEEKISKKSSSVKAKKVNQNLFETFNPEINDKRKYDRSIYEFESSSDSSEDYAKPLPVRDESNIEKRFIKVVTQRRNPQTGNIEAIERFVPNEGYSLDPDMPEYNIIPLDPITLLPIKKEEDNINEEMQKEKKKKEKEKKKKMQEPKQIPPPPDEKETIPDDLLFEFASDSDNSDPDLPEPSGKPVYFMFTPVTKLVTNKITGMLERIVEVEPSYVDKQIKVGKYIKHRYIRKPNTVKNEKYYFKIKKFLPDKEYSMSPMIMSTDEFLERYGTLHPELPDELKEVYVDKYDNTELNGPNLKMLKPRVICIDNKFYIQTVENNVVTHTRCTQDGKKIVMVMKENKEGTSAQDTADKTEKKKKKRKKNKDKKKKVKSRKNKEPKTESGVQENTQEPTNEVGNSKDEPEKKEINTEEAPKNKIKCEEEQQEDKNEEPQQNKETNEEKQDEETTINEKANEEEEEEKKEQIIETKEKDTEAKDDLAELPTTETQGTGPSKVTNEENKPQIEIKSSGYEQMGTYSSTHSTNQEQPTYTDDGEPETQNEAEIKITETTLSAAQIKSDSVSDDSSEETNTDKKQQSTKPDQKDSEDEEESNENNSEIPAVEEKEKEENEKQKQEEKENEKGDDKEHSDVILMTTGNSSTDFVCASVGENPHDLLTAQIEKESDDYDNFPDEYDSEESDDN